MENHDNFNWKNPVISESGPAVDFLEKPLNGLSTQRVIKATPET